MALVCVSLPAAFGPRVVLILVSLSILVLAPLYLQCSVLPLALLPC